MKANYLSDEAIVSALKAEASQIDAPEHVIQRAFSAWKPKVAAKPSLAHRIFATLKFDSLAISPIAMGVRSVSSSSRQVLFSAEGRDIDVRIAPLSKSGKIAFSVSGQVLGPDESGSVSLENAANQWSSNLNELSEFQIDEVPAGKYEMTVSLGDTVIVLPKIDVGTV
jgi:hypothetical protein